MTALAKKAERSVTTVTRKHFKDWHQVCAALVAWLRQQGIGVPPDVLAYAQREYTRARLRNIRQGRPRTDEQYRSEYEAAVDAGDAGAIAHSADRLIRTLHQHRQRRDEHAADIIDIAEQVLTRLDLIDVTSGPEDMEICLRVMDAAVDAHRALAVGDAESAHLGEIMRIKRLDRTYSRRIGRFLRDEIAKFHLERAEALVVHSADGEINALVSVVQRVSERTDEIGKPNSETTLMLFTRLCAMAIAYSHPDVNRRLAPVREELLRWFGKSHAERDARRDAQALLKLMANHGVRAVDLLRVSRFLSIGDFLIARQLAHWAQAGDSELQRRFAPDGGADPNQLRIYVLERAVDFYSKMQRNSRSSGCAGVLSKLAREEARLLNVTVTELLVRMPKRQVPAWNPPPPQDVDLIRGQVDNMVLQAIIGVPLDKYQVMRLRHDLDPILAFLKRPEIYGVITIRTEDMRSPIRREIARDGDEGDDEDPPTRRTSRFDMFGTPLDNELLSADEELL
ncbi:hypothetical protein [Nocardia sp. NBC_01327]|uniref:hypothetical protein n=1 Tax=Nocardia sp. NBC_01327 TaxID=2903593 RepID=UPI002E0FA6B8|nr:hypothetical protein OG326_29355 [Nocardia sp. NBC_01327]